MKKPLKISLIVVGIAVVIFAGVMLSYRFIKSMDVTENAEINQLLEIIYYLQLKVVNSKTV